MKITCRVGYHFYTPKSFKGTIVSLIGLSRVSHVCISIQIPQGDDYVYECGWGVRSQWYRYDTLGVPYDSVYEDLELDINELNNTLPSGKRYSVLQVIRDFLFGHRESTHSCLSSVHSLRTLANKETKGRTVGGTYRSLKRQSHR